MQEKKSRKRKFLSYSTSGRIGILFLAHQGIAKPDIWRAWRNQETKFPGSVVFYGIFPGEIKGWIKLKPEIASDQKNWCTPRLVWVVEEGIKEILSINKDLQVLYLVSGADIPIIGMDSFVIQSLNLDNKEAAITSDFCHIHRRRSFIDYVKRLVKREKASDAAKYKELIEALTQATQWVKLSREDASSIVEHHDVLELLNEFHRDHGQYIGARDRNTEQEERMQRWITEYTLEKKSLEDLGTLPPSKEARKQLLDEFLSTLNRDLTFMQAQKQTSMCPDHYFFPTLLTLLHGKDKLQETCHTASSNYGEGWNVTSPVTWSSWKNPHRFLSNQEAKQ